MSRTFKTISILAVGLVASVALYQQRELSRLRGELAQRSSSGRDPPSKIADVRGVAHIPVAWAEVPVTPRPTAVSPPPPSTHTATTPVPQERSTATAAPAPPAAAEDVGVLALRETMHQFSQRQRDRDLKVPEGRKHWVEVLAAKSTMTAEQSASLYSLLDQEFERRDELGRQARGGMRTFPDVLAESRKLRADTDEKIHKLVTDAQFRAYQNSRLFSGPDVL